MARRALIFALRRFGGLWVELWKRSSSLEEESPHVKAPMVLLMEHMTPWWKG